MHYNRTDKPIAAIIKVTTFVGQGGVEKAQELGEAEDASFLPTWCCASYPTLPTYRQPVH